MVRPPFMQRRAARALSTVFTPVNTGEIGLYNDSASSQMLRLWLAFSALDAGAELYFFGTFKGRLTTHDAATVSGLIADEPRVPGRVDTQDINVGHTVDFGVTILTSATSPAFGIEYPIAIIKPGWTFFLQSEPAPAATVHAGLLWDWVFAAELDFPDSPTTQFAPKG